MVINFIKVQWKSSILYTPKKSVTSSSRSLLTWKSSIHLKNDNYATTNKMYTNIMIIIFSASNPSNANDQPAIIYPFFSLFMHISTLILPSRCLCIHPWLDNIAHHFTFSTAREISPSVAAAVWCGLATRQMACITLPCLATDGAPHWCKQSRGGHYHV